MKRIYLLIILFMAWQQIFPDQSGDMIDLTTDSDQQNLKEEWSDYFDLDYDEEGATIYAAQEKSQQIRTIKKDEIEKINPTSLPELLEDTCQVSIQQYGAYGNQSTINIRGFSGGRILILIDGVPVNSAQSGTFDLSSIPINEIEEIQVIAGGSDTTYNYSGAVGGIINIITRKKKKPGYEIYGGIYNLFYYPNFYFDKTDPKNRQFSKWYDFFDSQKANFGFSIGNDKINWNINGEGNRALNHYIYQDQNDVKRRRFNNEIFDGSASTALNFKLPLYMKLNLSSRFFYGNKNIPGPINSDSPGKQIEYLTTNSIYYDADLVGHENIDTELILNYKFHQINWQDRVTDNQHNLNSIYLVNRWGFIVTPWLTLKAGGDFDYHYLASNHIGQKYLFNGGGYVTGEFSISNISTIIPSVKLIYFEKYPIAVPKLGLVFYIHKQFTLKSNLFRTFKMPSLNDLYWPADSFARGNPGLAPEDGFGGDIIFAYAHPRVLSAETSFYVNYVRNAILWQPDDAGKWKPHNIGESFYFGINNQVRSNFSRYVELFASYSFLLSYVLTDELTFESNKRMPYRPMHSLGFGVTFNWKKGSINFSGHFESERFTSILNLTKLAPFFTLDINFSQTIKFVTIFASVKNALNYYYYLVNGYPMPGGSVTIGVKFFYQKAFKKKKKSPDSPDLDDIKSELERLEKQFNNKDDHNTSN